MKVTLLSYTPNPDEICDIAAHTCVAKNVPLDASENLKSLDRALESGHESVAEHASFTFMVEGISRACSHQLVRHRMASYAQQSQRYVSMDDFEYVTPPSVKNGSGLVKVDYDPARDEPVHFSTCGAYCKAVKDIQRIYKELVDAGIPEEDARYILPNACTTNITVTMNGRELRHFINLRTCNRAQWEIRELATQMMQLARKVAPKLMEGVGPNCMQKCGCQESKPCGEPVPFGAHTMKKNRSEDEQADDTDLKAFLALILQAGLNTLNENTKKLMDGKDNDNRQC